MTTPETRSERQTLALTPSELNDARLVAAFRNVEISVLLREEKMAEITAWAEQIRSIPVSAAS